MAMAAVHRTLGLMELLQRDLAGAQLLAHGDDVGSGADLPALVDAAELRTTRDTDGRQVGACSAHEKCGRGLVAAHQQHDPIEWVGADVLLDVDGRQVAVEHRSRPHSDFPEGGNGELKRKAARIEHPVADMLGDDAEMGVAGVELGPGVANPDHRAPLELVLGEAAVLEEGPIVEPHLVLPAEPGLAAELLLLGHAQPQVLGTQIGLSPNSQVVHAKMWGDGLWAGLARASKAGAPRPPSMGRRQRGEASLLATEPIVPAGGSDQHASNNHEASKGGKTSVRVAEPGRQPAE